MNAPARIFETKPAVRESVPLLIGLMGPSGGGKTFSALRLAKGIQSVTGGEIYGIDTEARRMLHYADRFAFRHLQFDAPFGSLDYLAAIRHCVAQGAAVVIVDSLSHEHTGPGGMLDYQEHELGRLAGDDWGKRERVKMLAWQRPKAARRAMIDGILQLNANFIFCFRAKETAKPVKQPNGKTEVVPQGFMPIAGEEMVFEQTLNCLLLPHADGVPTWSSDQVGERLMMKLPEQFRELFAESQPLSEEIGAALATWARGGQPVDEEQARAAARAAAAKGKDALQAHWKGLDQATRRIVQPIMDDLKATAARAASPATVFRHDAETSEIIDDDPGGNRRPADGGGGNAAELSATAAPASEKGPGAGSAGSAEKPATDAPDVKAGIDQQPPSGQPGPVVPAPTLTADQRAKLQPFAADLAKMNRPADVMLRTQKFWQDEDLGDDDVSPLAVAASAIMDAHLGRTRGEISIDDATALVRKVLPI